MKSSKKGVTDIQKLSKDMKFSQIQETLPFQEYSYIELHKKSFEKSELGILRSLIPIEELVK